MPYYFLVAATSSKQRFRTARQKSPSFRPPLAPLVLLRTHGAAFANHRSLKAVLLCNHNAPGCVSDMPLWASVAASAAAPWCALAHGPGGR